MWGKVSKGGIQGEWKERKERMEVSGRKAGEKQVESKWRK